MRWAEHVAHMNKVRNTDKILVRKPEGKRQRPFGRPRNRWVDNIRIDLREIVWEDMGWMAQDRDLWQALVKMVMNLQVP